MGDRDVVEKEKSESERGEGYKRTFTLGISLDEVSQESRSGEVSIEVFNESVQEKSADWSNGEFERSLERTVDEGFLHQLTNPVKVIVSYTAPAATPDSEACEPIAFECQLDLLPILFGGRQSVSEDFCFPQPSKDDIERAEVSDDPNTASSEASTIGCFLRGAKLTMSVDVAPLASDHLLAKLVPMQLVIKAAKNLPRDSGKSFADMDAVYKPVYAQYQFFGDSKPHTTPSMSHASAAKWRDSRVIWLGKLDAFDTKFATHVESSCLEVELHDRDRIEEPTREDQTETENANRKTVEDAVSAPSSAKASSSDFHGVARFSLRDLKESERLLAFKQRGEVLPVYPEVETREEAARKVLAAGGFAIEGDVSNAKAVRYNPYQDSGTYINIELRLACSLRVAMEKRREMANAKGSASTGEETTDRFNRMLFIFRYSDTTTLRAITNVVTSNNCAVLGVESGTENVEGDCGETNASMNDTAPATDTKGVGSPSPSPTTEQGKLALAMAALVNVELADGQLADSSDYTALAFSHTIRSLPQIAIPLSPMDLLTGCHVIDSRLRMIIVEGLADGEAMQRLRAAVPRDQPNSPKFTLLINPNVRFSSRQWSQFGATLKIISLSKPLKKIASSPKLFNRSIVSKACADGVNRLMQLRNDCTRLRIAKEFKMFPTTEELLELGRAFSKEVTDADMHGITTDEANATSANSSLRSSRSSMRRSSALKSSIKRRGPGSTCSGKTVRTVKTQKSFKSIASKTATATSNYTGAKRRPAAVRFSNVEPPALSRPRTPPTVLGRTVMRTRELECEALARLEAANSTEDVDPLSALDAYEIGSQKSHARSRRSRRSNKSRRSSAGTSVKSGSVKPSEMFDEEEDDDEEYSEGSEESLPEAVNHVRKNIMKYRGKPSNKPKAEYPEHPSGEVFMYSTQRLNYMSWHKSKLLEEEEKAKRGAMSSFDPEFLDSVVQADPLTQGQIIALQDAESRSRFLTKQGFVSAQSIEHGDFAKLDMQPSESRVADLQMPWEDPMDKEREACRNDARGGAGASEDPTRPKFDAIVSHTDGEFGMPGNELWGKPLDASAAEVDALREKLRREEKEMWEKKLVVDDPKFHAHLKGVGNHAMLGKRLSQLDKQRTLLRDEPKKLALRFKNDEHLQVPRDVGLSLEADEPFDQSRTRGGEDVRFAKHSRPTPDGADASEGNLSFDGEKDFVRYLRKDDTALWKPRVSSTTGARKSDVTSKPTAKQKKAT